VHQPETDDRLICRPQNSKPQGVEGADQSFTSMTVEPILEPGLNLQDRLFGEGDGQKSGGVKTLLNQMNDPLSENHGLARAGHREHDHGTLPMGDGLCLLRIELNVFHDWTSLNVKFGKKKPSRSRWTDWAWFMVCGRMNTAAYCLTSSSTITSFLLVKGFRTRKYDFSVAYLVEND